MAELKLTEREASEAKVVENIFAGLDRASKAATKMEGTLPMVMSDEQAAMRDFLHELSTGLWQASEGVASFRRQQMADIRAGAVVK